MPTLALVSSIGEQLGRVTQNLPGGGEERPGQIQMAESVAAVLAKSEAVVVEAGTGTGKSLAYLVPILLADKRAVIATATIALQDQLVSIDVPMAASGLGLDVSTALLKGRSNYLCQQRLAELDKASHQEQLELLRGSLPTQELARARAWAETTESGDKEELDPALEGSLWQALSVRADECPGASRCPSGATCFSEKARRRADEADIVVTNHHYYGLNLATGGALLGEHDVVVFDEAHHLPDVLGATCGSEISGRRLRSFSRTVRSILSDNELSLAIDRSAADLDNLLEDLTGETINPKDVELTAELARTLATASDRAAKVIDGLRKAKAKEGTEVEAKVDRAQVTATALVQELNVIVDSLASAKGADNSTKGTDVLWVDGSSANPVLKRTPLDVSDILERHLWGERDVVLTSATISDGLSSQLGLDTSNGLDASVLRVGSPFDYPNLGILYCPVDLPSPNDPAYRQGVRDEMVTLIKAAGGRTLGLFTSASAMREAAEDLRQRLDYEILMQGDKPKPALIEAFKADPSSVLIATMSFWQGVDLPGSTLSLVTIDRLPFPRPNEPVTQAKRKEAGRSAFAVVDLPRAETLLAQAAGRLIRRHDDQGVVAVLDSRLATNRHYRWNLINALPPFRRSKDRDEVTAFLSQLNESAELEATELNEAEPA